MLSSVMSVRVRVCVCVSGLELLLDAAAAIATNTGHCHNYSVNLLRSLRASIPFLLAASPPGQRIMVYAAGGKTDNGYGDHGHGIEATTSNGKESTIQRRHTRRCGEVRAVP